VCEVGHDGEARVGSGREVTARKKLVTHFPNEEKRMHPLKKKRAPERERERERATKRGIRTRAGWTSILCLPARSQFRNALRNRAIEARVAAFFLSLSARDA